MSVTVSPEAARYAGTRVPDRRWQKYIAVATAVVAALVGGASAAMLHVTKPRRRLAVFALAVTGVAVICSLVGASPMFTAARTGRPHRGPSLWSIVGVVLAVGLGSNVVGCFVLSEIYSPSSDAVLLAVACPDSTALV